ncbi:MAG: hypothetical protein HN576_14485 [Bacteriovoracaceae bacterium]|mgnify:CR=1 FL=1|jgi:hypothetical protein|nr:hypothetical protein [Bacteriovoracaceae bacterium]
MLTIRKRIFQFTIPTLLLGYPTCFANSALQSDWRNLSLASVDKIQQSELNRSKETDYKNLILAKRGMINGELNITNYYLSKIDDNDTTVLAIKIRYKAITEFIKGNYTKVIEFLSKPAFKNIKDYKQICLLKIVAMMTQKFSNQLRSEISKCRGFNKEKTINDSMWLTNMEYLKLREVSSIPGMGNSDIRNIITDQELVRIWLKTGLYLGEDKLISKNLTALPGSIYRSKRFRELMGFYWYRLGDYKKSLSFIEDINTTNTDNIRGNINLEEKKLELAFGHFKLALQKKANSINSLERAIPLAWTLEQWKDGNNLLGRLVDYNLDKNKLKALEVAFQIRQGNYKLARRNLNILDATYKGQAPLIVTQMQSYVAFRLNDLPILKIMSNRACKQYDGLNCWVQSQLLIWDNISKTSSRKESIKGENNFSLDALKAKVEITPIQEELIVDQYDIEELDSKKITIDNFMQRNN